METIFKIFLICLILVSCQETKKVEPAQSPTKQNQAENQKQVEKLSKLGIEKSSQDGLKSLDLDMWAPDFMATTTQGSKFHLREALKDGPVVLIFYRGYWCPYCTRYLAAFKDQLDQIKKTNGQIVAVAPEIAENQEKTIEMTDERILFITDSENKLMSLYNLSFEVTDDYNKKIQSFKGQTLEEINGQEEAYLPIPATYIIDTDGKVKWSHFDPNYRVRPNIDEIVEVLKDLKAN